MKKPTKKTRCVSLNPKFSVLTLGSTSKYYFATQKGDSMLREANPEKMGKTRSSQTPNFQSRAAYTILFCFYFIGFFCFSPMFSSALFLKNNELAICCFSDPDLAPIQSPMIRYAYMNAYFEKICQNHRRDEFEYGILLAAKKCRHSIILQRFAKNLVNKTQKLWGFIEYEGVAPTTVIGCPNSSRFTFGKKKDQTTFT